MSDTNQSPHDRFLRKAFARLPLAREFLQHYLPKNVSQLVDFATLAQGKDTYVKDNLRQEITDLLYSVNFAGKPGYLYILIEHSSTSSPLLPFRLLKYMVAIMDDHLKNSKSKTLPVIYPLIFYTGKRPYHHSTDLYDLFGKDKRLARLIYNKPFALIDLNQVSDQELSGFRWFQVVGLSMKYIRKITVLPNLKKILNVLREMGEGESLELFELALSYIWKAANMDDPKAFAATIRDELTVQEKNMTTLAEYYHQQGHQVGHQEGHQVGRQEGHQVGHQESQQKIARNFLQMGLTLEGVAQGTGLTLAEVKALQRTCKVDSRKTA